MAWFYRMLVAWLVSLSADESVIADAHHRATSSVSVARASLDHQSPIPLPNVDDCGCGETCVGGVWKPDGRIEQRCVCTCDRCVSERAK